MDVAQASELIWNEAAAGRWFPPALHGALTLEQAHRVQLSLLERKLAGGARQAGWKVGLTSERVRKRYGTEDRPFGHILEENVHPSGAAIPLRDFPHAALEPELCFTFGETLRGPGITPERVRAAVAGVAPAFELNQNRAQGVSDFSLAVADNLSQWGIVKGAALEPIPADFDFGEMGVEFRRGGEVVTRSLGREVIDDHFLSLSILANTLAGHGQSLAAGMRVITGSYAKEDVAAGEAWEAEFSGIGTVRVSFV